MTTYWTIIAAAAKKAGVSAMLLYSICAHESRDYTLDFALFDSGSPSYSVCQVKEETARMLGFNGNPIELRNPYIGVKYAALYLAYQQQRYGGDWVKIVSSYNAGSYAEGRVKGCPRNLKYLKLVQEKLPRALRYKLECGEKSGN